MTPYRFAAAAAVLVVSLAACGKKESPAAVETAATETVAATVSEPADEPVVDKFTYANYDEALVTHLDLDLTVDFASKTLDGMATLDILRAKADAPTLVLDTDDLAIRSVETQAGGGEWAPAQFTLAADDPVMGSKLEITLADGADKVRIAYATSPGAQGLQWLDPAQTAGKTHPFMYSQNQAIHARSMAPVQDTPAVRMTYSATIKTPPELLAVMSAAQDDGPRDGDYQFDMPQPIPIYLLAIAVGDMAFAPINDHIGVYAEGEVAARAATEFEDTPQMEEATAALYGPYRWARYDMLVLPPSFPFGGMENPRLTFLTPTLLAGDKSLVATVAHELAHSWSGNLVTNATWRDAWLNEGFTSYVENRVIEAIYGRERAVMEQALSLEDLKRDIAEAERPELTQLKMPRDLAHPDDAFSQVSYVKGQFFLMFLEERFGRATFDEFLKQYFEAFAFKSITTEEFRDYLDENLIIPNSGRVAKEDIDEWLYGQGLPASAAAPVSDAFAKVDAQLKDWLDGRVAAGEIQPSNWSAHEWLHFLESLPGGLAADQFKALDEAFHLSGNPNAEIASAWYLKSVKAGYEPALPALREFLLRVGRGKFINRLYTALADSGRKDWANEVYATARPGYHPITQKRIDEILK
ncbi:MAG: M1 family metallopeptidase [Parvularculaceae bacterium]